MAGFAGRHPPLEDRLRANPADFIVQLGESEETCRGVLTSESVAESVVAAVAVDKLGIVAARYAG